jgi:hypothetical protein
VLREGGGGGGGSEFLMASKADPTGCLILENADKQRSVMRLVSQGTENLVEA